MPSARQHLLIGLTIRLLLTVTLPALLDDGLLLQGVRYTDIDYDVFTDAAHHVANGNSPYKRHTYRYTPFLAGLLALPSKYSNNGTVLSLVMSTKYFGKILFSIADAICGYIIALLRRRQRTNQQQNSSQTAVFGLSADFIDALWWLYNPLPINICTRGSAESLVVLLPVLATVAIAEMHSTQPLTRQARSHYWSIVLKSCLAGILHGVGIHAKLYPLIYTVSFMAYFSHQQQSSDQITIIKSNQAKPGWTNLLSESMQYLENCFCCGPSKSVGNTFPWRHPVRILVMAMLWVERLFMTMSSVLFLVFTLATTMGLTYAAVQSYGREAWEEGLLYHFQRVDHRHNYSIYWYWIYLSRGRAATSALSTSASLWGHIPTIPQIFILGFTSLGIAPYDLTLALFVQTFAFVAFNKVMTAQYFTWYLCLLPLCSDRISWRSKRMLASLALLGVSIVSWLLSAFTLEMLGWRTHRHLWLASMFFFIANINLLVSILDGYKSKKMSVPGQGWAKVKLT